MSARAITREIVSSIAQQFKLGFLLFAMAPLVIALVVVPEFAQHIAEIQLGMFDSRAAAKLASADPLRWAFGYVKLAGLALTFFASARFWWCHAHGGRWYDVRAIAWGRLLLGFVLFMLIGSVGQIFALMTNGEEPLPVSIIASVLSLPFLFVMLAGLFGDRSTAVKLLLLNSWPWLLMLLLLLPLGYGPLFWLHGMNHQWALGAHQLLIWLLMIFDALVVGLMASLVGSAFFVSYDRFFQRHGGDRI